ncbi:MAG: CpsD/CapB family tyrosine-protein kinase [Clostridia bacterium]|nr:CpsD/CapB family tyrosine-protein kinase [Clostridia bacterium]
MKEIALREKHELSSVMGEVYNRLRTNIEFSGDDNKIICVTSCSANDGKSSISYYLARSMAKNGKRVLYIDADLRNSVMHYRMGYDKATLGLSHFLVGKADIQDVMYKTSYDGLYFIPTGVFSRHPSELLGGERFANLLKSYREVFDYILIDTPPVGSVVDAVVVANNSDAHIIVVGAGLNSKHAVKRAIDDMSVAKSHFLGVVVNKVKTSTSGYYRYTYNYNYNYGNKRND